MNIQNMFSSINSSRFLLGINIEIQDIKEQQTWSIVLLPEGKHPIGCKWIYKIKRHANGNARRFSDRRKV
ncbi:hypothetical protein ERO13_D10G207950v2 [Gossypium hirsutum]|uniref:Reverse transcriptase Ty1/copia-type domain-containing protein n=3 Tax=Gossypium TaxID=3633 RepID=A0A5J5PUP0_GOSBA|nr:hypothetical protein ES319_D10G234200v1 [Gossypium barbadense]KAG4127286.1 hypothetical protein ERO13_D10G207950v2 [Gossypium hirsutum]TYG51384.1 hypothetical protein ES288_D10G253300v1 [Gossypium darwinii]TYH51148.1 hypothetical protein ES332_D10G254100v1 [Gossypium tomentosum]